MLFGGYVKELSIHARCTYLAENMGVERMAVRGGCRPLSGLIVKLFI